MPKSRKQYSPSEKAAILREHLIDRVPISDVCEKHGLHPTLFYQWQKTLFENLPNLFERKTGKPIKAAHSQIEALHRKLHHKDEVIAAIMEDFIAVKKTLGEA
jgi:transposase-like protein